MRSISDLKIPKTYSLANGVSQSQLATFAQCRMKWLLYVNRYTTFGSGADTNFGNIFHHLLSTLYLVGYEKMSLVSALWVVKKKYPEVDKQIMETDCAVASVVFQAYMKHYEKQDRRIVTLSSEKELKYTNGLDVRKVKLDLLYQAAQSLWVMEHKTRGRIDEDGLALHLLIDFQSLYYVTTVEGALKKPVAGVKYNIVRNPQLRRKVDETLKEYCDRVAEDIAGRPDFYFIRAEIVYSKEDKQFFLAHEYRGVIEDLKACVAGKSLCYRNTAACLRPYKCEYLEACASGNLDMLVHRMEDLK